MSEVLSGSNIPISRDESQALRMRRYLMAAGTSLLFCLTLLVLAFLGRLPWNVARDGTLAILALVVLFYPVAMLFGVLRLNSRRLMALALLTLAAHGTMLALLMARHPGLDRGALFAEFAVLAVVLPWFAAMGGYVNRLRTRLSDSHRDLKRAFDRIEQLAVRDALTGSYNRRFLMDGLAAERSRVERLGTVFSVCLLDVERFKVINDELGHAAGDAVLKELPALAAPGLGERPVTVTIGVAEYAKREELAALLARVDRALYAGKASGRNRVVLG